LVGFAFLPKFQSIVFGLAWRWNWASSALGFLFVEESGSANQILNDDREVPTTLELLSSNAKTWDALLRQSINESSISDVEGNRSLSPLTQRKLRWRRLDQARSTRPVEPSLRLRCDRRALRGHKSLLEHEVSQTMTAVDYTNAHDHLASSMQAKEP